MTTKYPPQLIRLIGAFKQLPGVGSKSAERFAFHLLDWSADQLNEMAKSIETTQQLRSCDECGCLVGEAACLLCDTNRRDPDILCIVAHLKDVFAIEQTHEYKGLYHVLGGVLSPLEGVGPDHLSIHKLKERIRSLPVKEVVIALDSTLEGDATAFYLKRELAEYNLPTSRLAFGLPMGSALDYVDGGTLARALRGRSSY